MKLSEGLRSQCDDSVPWEDLLNKPLALKSLSQSLLLGELNLRQASQGTPSAPVLYAEGTQ